MKFATLNDGSRDGRLAIISRDLTRAVAIPDLAKSLQEAVENWAELASAMQTRYDALNAGFVEGEEPFDPAAAMAPMPRAWQWLDGSAFESHGALMAQVFGIGPVPREAPLMYQGVSDTFYGPTDDVPLPSEEHGIDFEGEYGVIVDAVPMGCRADDVMSHIRLIVQINDWSLRAFAAVEMKTGFGWINAKPPCSMAPVAVTPDELGPYWRNGRVALPLNIWWNGDKFGAPDGEAMGVGFHDLIAHATQTRKLVPGTILGSGTVSNENFREVGSACITERRGIETIDFGAPKTSFMKFGDRVRMETTLPDGTPLFGAIDQQVVKAGSRAVGNDAGREV